MEEETIMSARFWLFSCVSAGVALTGGYGLGLYATTPPKTATETPLPEAVLPEDAAYDPVKLTGPAVIHCKGCGPTLADRQMAADMAGWDGMNDPVVRDYAAQDVVSEADDVEPPPPARTLPASIERFVAGESEGSLQPVKIAQAPNSKPPAEDSPADAAFSY
ncbi:hypothetical protein K426_20325 [Sphingobium sp. TKS]|nr:hypothetical protein K426_20325 [Sphingobium sp. TKS]